MNKLGSDLADAWLNKKLVDLNKFNNNAPSNQGSGRFIKVPK